MALHAAILDRNASDGDVPVEEIEQTGGGLPAFGHDDEEGPALLLHARNEARERGGFQQTDHAFRYLSRRQVYVGTVRAPHRHPGKAGLAREELRHAAGLGPLGCAGQFIEGRRRGFGVQDERRSPAAGDGGRDGVDDRRAPLRLRTLEDERHDPRILGQFPRERGGAGAHGPRLIA